MYIVHVYVGGGSQTFLKVPWVLHMLYFDNIYYPNLPRFANTYLPNFVSKKQVNEKRNLSMHAAKILLDMWSSNGTWNTRSYTLRENCLSLFQQLTLTNNFTTRVGILCPFPLFVLRFGLAWVCTNCHNCCELMYTSVLLCSENNVTYSFHSLWPLHTLSIPLPFGGCFV